MGKRKKLRKRNILCLCLVLLVAALNGAAWISPAFPDWYIKYIFPLWVGTYGRVTGLFRFSVGEWMIVAGLLLLAAAAVLAALWAGLGVAAAAGYVRRIVVGKAGKNLCGNKEAGTGGTTEQMGEKGRGPAAGDRKRFPVMFRKFSGIFWRFFGWTILTVSLIMTLNCFILYHASTFSEQYFGGNEEEYTLEELMAVYNLVAGQCNRLAGAMERDRSSMVLYKDSNGDSGNLEDMADKARELMRQLGEDYPQLQGYYPRPKALHFSDFMCQQHMQGYYFPFSMEANYNDVMHILNIPATMCHELAHLRGYIYEDEANFIGYLACVESEDIFFQYAGYLSVLVYLNNDLYRAWKEEPEAYEEAAAVMHPVAVDAIVWEDNIFVTEEEWERINGKALIDTEIVDKAADVFIDTNLKINGIRDGKISYSRVVSLLLQYYRHQA